MNVLVVAKRLEEVGVLAEVGEDAQLDLGVVGAEQARVGADVAGDEGGAHLAAQLRADGDVLEVRIVRREAAGGGHRLVEGGMDAVRLRVDQRRQGVDVGGLELGELTVLKDEVDGGVDAAQGVEHEGIGGVAQLGAARVGEAQLLEEHVRKLLRRGDVELMPHFGVDLLLQRRRPARPTGATSRGARTTSRATPVISMRVRTGTSGISTSAKSFHRFCCLSSSSRMRAQAEGHVGVGAGVGAGPDRGARCSSGSAWGRPCR